MTMQVPLNAFDDADEVRRASRTALDRDKLARSLSQSPVIC